VSGRLAGKACLVTAAGQGIGRATALAYADEGASVIATDIDAQSLDGLSRERPEIQTHVLDVTDAAAIETLVRALARVDVLFNCAGCVAQGALLECSPEEWRRSFALNVDSMFFLCRAVLPGMVKRGGGCIVNMSSVASSVKAVPNRFAYSASKAAVIGLTKSIAADYVAHGIRCNAICPGTVMTPSLRQRAAAGGPDEEASLQQFKARQPMGRLGEPREIAALAVYLAAEESAFTTGAIHVIDGGWTA
jgi:2-keto-3-deoxy-L-fuconate dehydrogenase